MNPSNGPWCAWAPVALVLAGIACALGAAPTTAPRLDRDNLLLFLDPSGQAQPVRSVSDWQQRRTKILRDMQTVMGPLPGADKRVPLDVQVVEETDAGMHVRRLISYQAEPGGRVPAYLLIPKALLSGGGKAPAVLCPHPTDDRVGHKVVVGLGGKNNRAYAEELAGRGFVTLAPSYPLLANYQPDLKALGYESGTMKAIWDNIRGLDLLASLPFVQTNRGFGAIGHSLGGHNSVYTAAFDERLRVVITNCGLDSFMDYMDGNIKGWTSQRYMPRLLGYRLEEIPFDFQEVIGVLSPRHVFIVAPLGDSNFKWQSVDRVAQAARAVYELYGARDHLRVAHPDGAHDFPDDMRQEAYRLLEKVLRE